MPGVQFRISGFFILLKGYKSSIFGKSIRKNNYGVGRMVLKDIKKFHALV